MMGWQGVKFYDFALTCIVILTTLTLLWMCAQQYHAEMKFVADLNNNNNTHFTALCLGLRGRGSTRRNIYPPTILIISQSLSATSSTSILPLQITCLAIFLYNLSPHPLWSTSWSGDLHIQYISSPNQCLLFATCAHTIVTCFAVARRLYNLFLVFLSTLYFELYLLP